MEVGEVNELEKLGQKLKLDRQSSYTLVDQLVKQLGDMIDTGNLSVDTRLPAPMKLSKAMGIAYCTVDAAYKTLSELGYIQRSKRGSFVRYPMMKSESMAYSNATRKVVLLFLDEAQEQCIFKRHVVSGIRDTLKEPQFSIEVMRISDFQAAGQDWTQELTKRNGYDAVIIDKEGVSDFESQQFAQNANTPFMLFGSMLWSFYHDSLTILPDYGSGIHQVVDHLVELGHKSLALLIRNRLYRPDFIKEQSLLDAMHKHGLSNNDATIIDGVGRDRDSIFAATDKLLAADKPPTAVVCSDDIVAFEVMRFCEGRGIDVPRELSVVGYNDFDVCSINTPQITTVRVPMREMGQQIGEKLLERMAGKGQSGIVHIPVKLMVRDSSGKCLK